MARNYAKLLANKDEFEVARLYASEEFQRELKANFDGDLSLTFHVAGGPFGKRDKVTGKLRKTEVGPWLMKAFKVLARLRGLRGTLLDPFRKGEERQLARQLLSNYEADLQLISKSLTRDNYQAAMRLADWPEHVRGYGHIRAEHAAKVAPQREQALADMQNAGPQTTRRAA